MADVTNIKGKKPVVLKLASLPPLRECDKNRTEFTRNIQNEEKLVIPNSVEELRGENGYLVYKIKNENDWHIGIIDFISPCNKKFYMLDAAERNREHRMLSISSEDLEKGLFIFRTAEREDLKGLKLPSKNGEAFGRAAFERKSWKG